MRIAVNVVLFLLPFAFYVVFLHLKERSPFVKEHWERRPVIWLGTFGLILSAGFFFISAMSQGLDPNAAYVPAHMENGRLVPAHMEPRPPDRAR